MNAKTILLITIIGMTANTIALAQEIATTKNGRDVILNSNGTWEYLNNNRSSVKESANETLRAYLSASSWRERTTFVLDPNRIAPLMEVRYSGKLWKEPKFELLSSKELTTGWVAIKADTGGNTSEYYLKKTEEGYKIDWESSVGFNTMSPKEFNVTKPTTPVRFKVEAKLDDHHNYEFHQTEDIFYSIALQEGGGNRIGYGYVKKKDAIGQKLFEKLKDGRRQAIIVEIQCLPNASNGRFFLISQVINWDGWWQEESTQSTLAAPTAKLAITPATKEERLWTDITGGFQINAKFVDLKDQNVTLEKDGEKINLPLSRLSSKDQNYVQKMAVSEK
ncbi:MAG: SHD1 domain-containing protein [Kiritimatiellia bacterium]